MDRWSLRESDLKRYPHFDPMISAKDAEALATDAEAVAKHTFYPFIRYTQRWNRFADEGQKGKVKERPIRYAARRDAYIFSYYRYLLSTRFEAELERLGLGDSVLAYRRIPDKLAGGGKCNIHFARDAIQRIREIGDCCVIAIDISSYFEHLDHDHLKALWCRMLGVDQLPLDHFRVYKAITQYAVVDKEKVYERLGYFGEKRRSKSGKPIYGYLKPHNENPKHLCTGREFRTKIAGHGPQKSVIEKNHKPYGIPQGAPISDLLANLYLIDFDCLVDGWINDLGGTYYRYSDDILLIVPGREDIGKDLMRRVQEAIRCFGEKLVIKEDKSSLLVYFQNDDDQEFRLVEENQGRNGLEYLGFRYDGKAVYLRDSTLSNLYRKVTRTARREANAYARRYPDKDVAELRALFDYERLIKRFGRVEDFRELQQEYRHWTFWTYASRAAKEFGPLGRPILRQLRKHRDNIRRRVDEELRRAVFGREKRRLAQDENIGSNEIERQQAGAGN